MSCNYVTHFGSILVSKSASTGSKHSLWCLQPRIEAASVWHPTSARTVSSAAQQQQEQQYQQQLVVASLSCAVGSLDVKMFQQLSGRTAPCAAALLCRYSVSSPLAVGQARLALLATFKQTVGGGSSSSSSNMSCIIYAVCCNTVCSTSTGPPAPSCCSAGHLWHSLSKPLQPLLQQRLTDGGSFDMRILSQPLRSVCRLMSRLLSIQCSTRRVN